MVSYRLATSYYNYSNIEKLATLMPELAKLNQERLKHKPEAAQSDKTLHATWENKEQRKSVITELGGQDQILEILLQTVFKLEIRVAELEKK